MPKPRALITGGAGFIGSHLAHALLEDDHDVIVVDNFLTGTPRNLEGLFGQKGFRFIEHDITNYLHVGEDLDYVFHFASPASPIDYHQLPIQTLKVGSLGTHIALGVAREKKARFLLASTSEVYGDPLVHPQPESYWGNVNPIGPRGVYDEAKRFGEAMTMAYHRVHGLDTKIVRIFNTYGPRMRVDDGRAIPTFLAQALANEPISIFGDGSQTRSFCYVSDLVRGIIALSRSDQNEPVNIGNPIEMTVKQLTEFVIKVTGSSSELTYKPLPVDDPKVRQPDITRARTLLGWEPEIDLEDGLTRTMEDFRERLAEPSVSEEDC